MDAQTQFDFDFTRAPVPFYRYGTLWAAFGLQPETTRVQS